MVNLECVRHCIRQCEVAARHCIRQRSRFLAKLQANPIHDILRFEAGQIEHRLSSMCILCKNLWSWNAKMFARWQFRLLHWYDSGLHWYGNWLALVASQSSLDQFIYNRNVFYLMCSSVLQGQWIFKHEDSFQLGDERFRNIRVGNPYS